MSLTLWEWEPMTERSSAAPAGFGSYIKSLRIASGLKQRAIAEAIGMSQSQFSGMENNANPEYLPAPGIVRGLASVFGVKEADLIRAAGYLADADESSTATEHPALPAGLPAHIVERVLTNLISFDELLMEAITEARGIADEREAEQRRETIRTATPRIRQRTAG